MNKIKNEATKNIARLLTQLDRDPLSPTFGCFDRNYWHYKIRDFASMVVQQNVLSLGLLYINNFEGNFLYNKKIAKDYILGALNYWMKAQHHSGGFDEYWPNESGYPPLVFSTHAVIKTIRILNLNPKPYLKSIEKSIKQIEKNKEVNALNQEAAGVCALFEYYKLTGDKKTKLLFKNRLDDLLSKQTKEGWFPEYGGADVGYSSVFLHYLSEILIQQKNKKLEKSLVRLIDFLSNFVHPNGSVGGEYGSRNTEYFLLGGLVNMTKYSQTAREMILNISWSLDNLDDRYLFHYIYHSFIKGLVNMPNIKNQAKAKQKNKNIYFAESGLYIAKNTKYYFVTNLKKGGIYKFYKNYKLVSKDGGYRINNKNSFLVSNWLNYDTKIKFNKKQIDLETIFFINNFNYNSPIRQIFLRLISIIPYKKQVIMFLKKLLIFQDKKSKFKFVRSFKLNNDSIQIEDTFPNLKLNTKITSSIEASMRFVPSSKFSNSEDFQLDNLQKSFLLDNNNKVYKTFL